MHYRKEIFHVPFNIRYRVAKQRYSIEGLPCLYLAACSYTAWLELNRPNFNDLWASSFRVTEVTPILDFAFTIEKLEQEFLIPENEKCVKYKLKLFPFIIATSFRVKYPNALFHEEYIISNIILQWVMNNERFKGIRYLSTKLEFYSTPNLWCAANFVLPPSKHTNEDYNPFLSNLFKLTLPQNWSVLTAYSNAGSVSCLEIGDTPFLEDSEDFQERSLPSSSIDELIFNGYIATRFYNIDGYLRRMFKYDLIEKNA